MKNNRQTCIPINNFSGSSTNADYIDVDSSDLLTIFEETESSEILTLIDEIDPSDLMAFIDETAPSDLLPLMEEVVAFDETESDLLTAIDGYLDLLAESKLREPDINFIPLTSTKVENVKPSATINSIPLTSTKVENVKPSTTTATKSNSSSLVNVSKENDDFEMVNHVQNENQSCTFQCSYCSYRSCFSQKVGVHLNQDHPSEKKTMLVFSGKPRSYAAEKAH